MFSFIVDPRHPLSAALRQRDHRVNLVLGPIQRAIHEGQRGDVKVFVRQAFVEGVAGLNTPVLPRLSSPSQMCPIKWA
jgi:hypothetical protein